MTTYRWQTDSVIARPIDNGQKAIAPAFPLGAVLSVAQRVAEAKGITRSKVAAVLPFSHSTVSHSGTGSSKRSATPAKRQIGNRLNLMSKYNNIRMVRLVVQDEILAKTGGGCQPKDFPTCWRTCMGSVLSGTTFFCAEKCAECFVDNSTLGCVVCTACGASILFFGELCAFLCCSKCGC